MYGLIGKPLGHSFSATYFNEKFKTEGIDNHYDLFPIDSISELKVLLESHSDLQGLNVTIPYKEQVLPYLTDIDSDARKIGAVNVIAISQGGKTLKGYNTDAIGFRNSIKPLLKPHMKKALVLGTGGASKAVAHVLKSLGLEVTKVSRNKHDGVITYEEITSEIMEEYHVIVNTTPLGTWPKVEDAPPIPYHLATEKHLFHDLVYNPAETTFMHLASAQGAMVKNGLEMLHGQAIAAWEIWNS